MRLRLLIVIGVFILVFGIAFLFLNQSGTNGETENSQNHTRQESDLEVLDSQGDPQATSHLLQGTQSNGSLQSSQTGLQDSTSGQQLQPNSGRDSF